MENSEKVVYIVDQADIVIIADSDDPFLEALVESENSKEKDGRDSIQ